MWSLSDFRYKLQDIEGNKYGFDNTAKLEKVGNIHDNGELLKG